MTDFKGKTALVTGSTSGIGRATAIALAARGAHVLIVGRDEQRAKDAVAEIEGSGGSAAFRLATLGDGQSAHDLVEWAYEAGLDGAPMVSSGANVRFPDHEPALRWCNSSDYQQLIEVRGIAMDARFSLLDGLPRPTEGEREPV